MHLRIELRTECKENPEQLMKVYVVWLKVLNITVRNLPLPLT